jgi:hypothetical protein
MLMDVLDAAIAATLSPVLKLNAITVLAGTKKLLVVAVGAEPNATNTGIVFVVIRIRLAVIAELAPLDEVTESV